MICPITREFVEIGQIAVRVFKERFSEETYRRLEREYFVSDSSDGGKKSEGVNAQGEDDDPVDDITKGLEEVEIPDDWEDLASDSD